MPKHKRVISRDGKEWLVVELDVTSDGKPMLTISESDCDGTLYSVIAIGASDIDKLAKAIKDCERFYKTPAEMEREIAEEAIT